MSALSLGDRIGQIRRRRGMTQEELAERSGISKPVIAQLEQNRREGARIKTLHALARALEVKTSDLLGDGVELDPEENGYTAQLLELRRVLIPSLIDTGEDVPVPAVAELRTSVLELARIYHESQLSKALGLLPDTLRNAERTAASQTGDYAMLTYRLLAHVYITASRTLVQVRHEDLAYEAIRRAMAYAEKAGDEMLYAMAGDSLCWIFLRQARFDDAEKTAERLAAAIEPSFGSANLTQMSAWARLQIQAAGAAARNNRPRQAQEFLSLARSAAARLGSDHLSFETYHARFGPTNVAMTDVECAMIAGEPDRALRLSRSIVIGDTKWRTSYTRYFVTLAEARVATRQYTGAVQDLIIVRDVAPEWLANQRAARDLVRQLLDVLPVQTSKGAGLAELAGGMDIRP
jgi:transcriptional regulator with XRE-family HTH domain